MSWKFLFTISDLDSWNDMSWNVLEIFDKCLGLSYIETTIFGNGQDMIRTSWTEFFFSHKWVGHDKLSWMEFFFSNAKCLGLISGIEEQVANKNVMLDLTSPQTLMSYLSYIEKYFFISHSFNFQMRKYNAGKQQ